MTVFQHNTIIVFIVVKKNGKTRRVNKMVEDTDIDDIIEEDVGNIMNVITTDGYYIQAQVVKVSCPACGEEFLGTKRHAGGFIAGHIAFHEFENTRDTIVESMGGI